MKRTNKEGRIRNQRHRTTLRYLNELDEGEEQ